MSNIILNKNITAENELLALAQEKREQGKTDFVAFILNRSPTGRHTHYDMANERGRRKDLTIEKNSHTSPSRGF